MIAQRLLPTPGGSIATGMPIACSAVDTGRCPPASGSPAIAARLPVRITRPAATASFSPPARPRRPSRGGHRAEVVRPRCPPKWSGFGARALLRRGYPVAVGTRRSLRLAERPAERCRPRTRHSGPFGTAGRSPTTLRRRRSPTAASASRAMRRIGIGPLLAMQRAVEIQIGLELAGTTGERPCPAPGPGRPDRATRHNRTAGAHRPVHVDAWSHRPSPGPPRLGARTTGLPSALQPAAD